jgi:Glutathione-dependent formaldehyde-activating enzyme
MQTVTTIGLDIAKSVFQVHGVAAAGQVVIRRKLKRRYVLAFFQKLPPCLIGIEAWDRISWILLQCSGNQLSSISVNEFQETLMKIDGRCHCGYVTFQAEADPETTTICNCTDCQTMSGAPLRAVIITRPGTFVLLSGKPTEYRKTVDSGNVRL